MLQTPAYRSLFDLSDVMMIQMKEKIEKAIQTLSSR